MTNEVKKFLELSQIHDAAYNMANKVSKSSPLWGNLCRLLAKTRTELTEHTRIMLLTREEYHKELLNNQSE